MKRTSTSTSATESQIDVLKEGVIDVDEGAGEPNPDMDPEGLETLIATFGRGTCGNIRLCGRGTSLKELTGKGD